MDLRELRRILLAQHAHLRELMHGVDLTLEVSPPNAAELGLRLARLRDVVLAHNAAEEATLGPMLSALDHLGPARVKQMLDAHHEEHHAMVDKLGAGVNPEVVREVLTELRTHMDYEEQSILSDALLPPRG
jgi:hypothetical protein